MEKGFLSKETAQHADHVWNQLPWMISGGGGQGAGDREKGGGRCTGGGRRGGGKREKKGKITQHCAIFRNRKIAKGREPKNTGRKPGLKGTGSGRFKPPCPPHLIKARTLEHSGDCSTRARERNLWYLGLELSTLRSPDG